MEKKEQQQEQKREVQTKVQPDRSQDRAGEHGDTPQPLKPGPSEHFRELGEEAPAGNYGSPEIPVE